MLQPQTLYGIEY